MMRLFFEAFEKEKLAQGLPGGFNLNQPYTMPARARRATGTPVGQSTVPSMKMTGTVGKKPKGMGIATTKQSNSAMGKAIPPMKGLQGGFKVKPNMAIVKKPPAGTIRLGSAYPTLEQARAAIDKSWES